MFKEDVLGYLTVLGGPVYNRLTTNERQIGHANIMGCLMRLADQMQNDPALLEVYEKVKEREYLNATLNLPVGDPKLQAATDILAEMLLGLLRNQISPAKRQDYLDQFDGEIAKIMRGFECRN